MEPGTWSIIASVASTVIGAVGQAQQGPAQAQSYQYQAAVAEQNRQVAEQYSNMEKSRGEQLAQQKEQQTAQQQGMVKAAAGASGLDPGSGSALRLDDDTLAMGRLDAATIRYNAGKAAYGYQVQGTSYGSQAQLDRQSADNASSAGNLNAIGAIISGGAGVADKWAKFKQTGVPGPWS